MPIHWGYCISNQTYRVSEMLRDFESWGAFTLTLPSKNGYGHIWRGDEVTLFINGVKQFKARVEQVFACSKSHNYSSYLRKAKGNEANLTITIRAVYQFEEKDRGEKIKTFAGLKALPTVCPGCEHCKK